MGSDVRGSGQAGYAAAFPRLTSIPTSLCSASLASTLTLQIAIKTNQAGVLYLSDAVPLTCLLEESGAIEGQAFLAAWKSLPPEYQQRLSVTVFNVEQAKQRLQAANLFVLAHRPVGGSTFPRPPCLALRPEGMSSGGDKGLSSPSAHSAAFLALLCSAAPQVPGTTQEALYLTCRVGAINCQILLEIRLVAGVPGLEVSFKCERADLAAMAFEAIGQTLA
jgi:hypothetical protein